MSETLNLANLTRGDDGAVFKCKVQNSLGSDEANATITVWCKYWKYFYSENGCKLTQSALW